VIGGSRGVSWTGGWFWGRNGLCVGFLLTSVFEVSPPPPPLISVSFLWKDRDLGDESCASLSLRVSWFLWGAPKIMNAALADLH
jgi:hypothetical protein